MAKIDVVNLKNEKQGSIDLSDDVFAQKVNQPLVHQVVKAQLAAKRQGTASSLTKGLVRGGGKKPFKQKGTGNARQGSSRSPLMPGGGSSFGPQPRKYYQYTPKKMIQGALRSVLSDKLASNHLMVIDNFELKSSKTKDLFKTISDSFKMANDKILFVDEDNKNLKLASRNLPKMHFLKTDGVNVYDLVKYEWLFISKESAKKLSDQLSGKGK